MHALLSVYDKTGITDLAQSLHDRGWSLLSSGGTAAAIAAAEIPVVDVADHTGSPIMLGHRVVTLHPTIHGGILADRANAEHQADLETHGITPIDLVVVNLYPFDSDPGIELIDIGGPTMVRAAAKNHEHVGVVVDPDDYAAVADAVAEGGLDAAMRRRLARKAFAHTAAYDANIVTWFDELDANDDPLPKSLHLAADRAQDLRYGENPHQTGARYRVAGRTGWWDTATQLQGKEMSFLNLYDAEAAWQLVWDLHEGQPTAVVIKHANPCGVAVDDDPLTAYTNAHACDPVSAFGGIVAITEPITGPIASAICEVFTEVVIAPSIDADAREIFASKPNVRVLEAAPPSGAALEMRSIDGGLLVQTVDRRIADRDTWRTVTDRAPSAEELDDLAFAWAVAARVSSNTIVLAKDRQAVGIGAGQQNRRDAGRIAADKAAGRAAGGACASDAFFPFRDGLDVAIEAGCTSVIQPGGSIRDDEVIAAANEAGIAMVFTGERHFRH